MMTWSTKVLSWRSSLSWLVKLLFVGRLPNKILCLFSSVTGSWSALGSRWYVGGWSVRCWSSWWDPLYTWLLPLLASVFHWSHQYTLSLRWEE
jgi:hypothetical protein